MDVKVPFEKVTTIDEAYAAVCGAITPELIAKFNVKAEIDKDDKAKKLTATGKGFKLEISFNKSEALADLDLSFLLKPFKGKVLEIIEKQLTRVV